MKRTAVLACAALALGVAAAPLSAAENTGMTHTYRVTVQNLTPMGSQPLSPPLLVVHRPEAHVWRVGEIASAPVAGVAEDANNGPAIDALTRLRAVRSAVTGVEMAGAAAPILPGTSQRYTVRARGGDRLSLLSMLVNTNDAFTGLDSLPLSGRTVVRLTRAYDAGTEVNNQKAAFIPGPAGGSHFVRDPEGDLIRMHPGIVAGVGDLDPAMYGWTGAVARITIQQMH